MTKTLKCFLALALIVPMLMLSGFVLAENDPGEECPIEYALFLEVIMGNDIENFMEDATKKFQEMTADPNLAWHVKSEMALEFAKLQAKYEKIKPELDQVIEQERERSKKVYPKPVHKGIDIDKLMEKWKASDNWVFIAHQTSDGMHDTTGCNIVNELEIVERNGNVFRKSHSLAMSENSEYTNRYYSIFDGNGKGRSYFCRKEHGDKNWVWQPQAGGEFEGTADKQFEKDIEWRALQMADMTVMREIDGVYHFWGIENMSEAMGRLGGKRRDEERNWYMTRNFTLTFGTSTVKEPTQDDMRVTICMAHQVVGSTELAYT